MRQASIPATTARIAVSVLPVVNQPQVRPHAKTVLRARSLPLEATRAQHAYLVNTVRQRSVKTVHTADSPQRPRTLVAHVEKVQGRTARMHQLSVMFVMQGHTRPASPTHAHTVLPGNIPFRVIRNAPNAVLANIAKVMAKPHALIVLGMNILPRRRLDVSCVSESTTTHLKVSA